MLQKRPSLLYEDIYKFIVEEIGGVPEPTA